MDEKTLIALAQNKNENALSQLLSDNYNIVYGYIMKLTKNHDFALDITQDTMVKAIMNINKFKGNSKFSTWLITIATNIFKNHIKKNKKITTINNDDFTIYLELRNKDLSVEKQFEIKEQFNDIINVLDNYKSKLKIPFILKHYYGYSYYEISKIVNCPIGTVRSRIHNVRESLRKELKGGFNEDF